MRCVDTIEMLGSESRGHITDRLNLYNTTDDVNGDDDGEIETGKTLSIPSCFPSSVTMFQGKK